MCMSGASAADDITHLLLIAGLSLLDAMTHSARWFNKQTSNHKAVKRDPKSPPSPTPAPHPVCVLLEHGLMDVACKQRRGKVAQVHHLIYHAILVCLPKYHVLLLLLIGVAAVGLGAVAPCSGALSEHAGAFQETVVVADGGHRNGKIVGGRNSNPFYCCKV